MRQLPIWLAAAWAMSLTMLGFMVVPMLFVHLPTPAMAGQMAAKLFSAQTWISVACGAMLLMTFRSNRLLVPVESARAATLFIVGGVLLALLVELAVAPRIVARENLALWHRWGSAMYFAQWVCALVVFKKMISALLPANAGSDVQA
ncbi:DUF4149 domain-containing protein [Rhodoferax mekongensis]|uniref:DUF4149 domain-containing protein n=1 Tax=Rhodoferax mekongensis TaxID=3068341 RepID=A0ABZ0AVL4_9BURK|nr:MULTISPECIES: DUF4149 domain-containing protein [unclassified Rhodoferax]MDT7515966.1 DUF4149 domain-containing protein [Rhodoferax sp. TBRC 17199]WNO03256.1 DUF4149 domain-containing protein [Rhodoferax sp. TBRC 17307]